MSSDVACSRVHDGADALAGFVGVIETEHVAELVNGHAAKILRARSQRAAIRVPRVTVVEDHVRLDHPRAAEPRRRHGESPVAERVSVERGIEEHLVLAVAITALSSRARRGGEADAADVLIPDCERGCRHVVESGGAVSQGLRPGQLQIHGDGAVGPLPEGRERPDGATGRDHRDHDGHRQADARRHCRAPSTRRRTSAPRSPSRIGVSVSSGSARRVVTSPTLAIERPSLARMWSTPEASRSTRRRP